MNHRCTFLVAVAFAVLSVSVLAEPKAYELIKYLGKAEGVTVAFDFADGYPEASEVRVTEAGHLKSTRLVLDESGEMHFVAQKERAGGGVTLKMSRDDVPPERVEGIYRASGKTIRFTLMKR